jgi:hypothetical protein
VRTIADTMAWIFGAMTLVGLLGGCLLSAYTQWAEGFDSGAPYSFFAGVRMLGFMFQHPEILTLFGIAAVGIVGMVITAPHTRWRARPKLESGEAEQLRRRVIAAQSLVSVYSKVLQTPRAQAHFWPVSALPADRETLKAALKLDAAYQASQGELDKPLKGSKVSLRDSFIGAYANLADFVPDDLAERVNPYWAFLRSEANQAEASKAGASAHAHAFLSLAPSDADNDATERAHEEYTALAAEMTAYLDRIAPRRPVVP